MSLLILGYLGIFFGSGLFWSGCKATKDKEFLIFCGALLFTLGVSLVRLTS